ncbi:MAG: leucine-rich repeat domain-containing protein, partial [Oscillospiraceae bacterium]|nr:leucine-rich repeat domain-containing protein [Oscillospiraceae bacterium]
MKRGRAWWAAAAFLVLILLLGLVPVSASAAEIVDSGYCGENWNNLSWTLDDTGLLTISGEGPMRDYLRSYTGNSIGWTYSPWAGQEITAIVIREGVTSVGSAAFIYCTTLRSVSLPQSLTQIGDCAFYGCSSLSSVEFPGGDFQLGLDVFADCDAFTSAFLPGGFRGSEPAVSSNALRNNYNVRADTVRSYLYRDGDTLVRFENVGGRLLVETYSPGFQLLDSRYLDSDLGDYWGGFFPGENYNFVILGHPNPEESAEAEVIHVRKYSKGWMLLGETGLFGANTTRPFDAASLRCAERDGILYIHTGHEMYRSNDGRNHQSNLTLCLRESDMEITDARYDISNISTGYVSHSFNQFILVDGDRNIVTLDHGDAHPRSAVLQRYLRKAGEQLSPPGHRWDSTEAVDVQVFPGAIGDNTTGASLGGLAETSTGYVTAYNFNGVGANSSGSVMGVATEDPDPVRNVFLSHTPKNAFTEKATTVRQLTFYEAGGTVTCSTPVLAPLGPEGGYVLWSLLGAGEGDTLCYARYAADGSVGEVRTAAGMLSDCRPIAADGKVLWYVTDNSAPVFYLLDENGLTVRRANQLSITRQPVSVTAESGTFAEFHVEAAGQNLRYQWQYWNGEGWANTGDDWNSGTDTMSFRTWEGGNGLCFRCVVWNAENGADYAFSDTVSLTVIPANPVTITTQPVSRTAKAGDYVSYRVEAAGKNLRYQWQYWNGQGWANTGDDWNSSTDTMSFRTWPEGSGLCFRCVVWNGQNG